MKILKNILQSRGSTILMLCFIMTSIFAQTTSSQINQLVYYLSSVLLICFVFLVKAIEELKEKN